MNMFAGRKKMFRVPLDSVDSAFPYTLVTAQTETERVLTEHLIALGVTVDRGFALTGLTRTTTLVHLTLQAPTEPPSMSNTWVVGTDGGHSTVRHLVGDEAAGSFKGEPFPPRRRRIRAHSTTRTCTRPSPGRHSRHPADARRPGAVPRPDPRGRVSREPRPVKEELQKIVDERIGIDHDHDATLVDLLRDSPRTGTRVPIGTGVPRRRRCAHPQPSRWSRHEHRHAGRFQPRLETRDGRQG